MNIAQGERNAQIASSLAAAEPGASSPTMKCYRAATGGGAIPASIADARKAVNSNGEATWALWN